LGFAVNKYYVLCIVEAVPHQVTPDDQMSLHQQEYSTVLAGGPQEVMSLPPRQHVWHPPGELPNKLLLNKCVSQDDHFNF